MKTCTKCGKTKPLIDFNKHAGRKDGYADRCKVCLCEDRKIYYSKNKEQIIEQQKEYKKLNEQICKERSLKYRERTREQAKQRAKTWYSQNKERAKKTNRKNKLKQYGLTVDQYNQLIENQNNSCLICKKEFSEQIKSHIDHCHASGKVRGILCQKCNQGIGLFYESLESLQSAIEYLKKHQ
jgi:Rps23 Pro-64 3,4-dihydroxylase Tpa1-like proline 4-hydroxylase